MALAFGCPAKLLMGAVLAHSDLQGLRRLLLATRDAHGLYAQFGFRSLEEPGNFMTLHCPDVYKLATNESI